MSQRFGIYSRVALKITFQARHSATALHSWHPLQLVARLRLNYRAGARALGYLVRCACGHAPGPATALRCCVIMQSSRGNDCNKATKGLLGQHALITFLTGSSSHSLGRHYSPPPDETYEGSPVELLSSQLEVIIL